jgi:hypothetical protein
LAGYLSGFTSTPGYRCDTTPTAPVILDGRTIVDPKVLQARDEALRLARADRAWKDGLLLLMDDAHAARLARLPTYSAVLENSDKGYATTLPMIVAWCVLRNQGSMTTNAFEEVCQKQADLIRNEIASRPDPALTRELIDTLALYEHELSALRRPMPDVSSLSTEYQASGGIE